MKRKVAGATGDVEALRAVVNAWLREMLKRQTFDNSLPVDMRRKEYKFFDPVLGADSLPGFVGSLKRLPTGITVTAMDDIIDTLFKTFTDLATDGAGRLLKPDTLRMRLALNAVWHQCLACGDLQETPLFGTCGNCGDKRMEPRPPDHPYMDAIKGFFRKPLIEVLNGGRPIHVTASILPNFRSGTPATSGPPQKNSNCDSRTWR